MELINAVGTADDADKEASRFDEIEEDDANGWPRLESCEEVTLISFASLISVC